MNKTEEEALIHLDKLIEISNSESNKNTILFVKNKNKPSGFATGVLLKIKDNHFILTSGHVAEGYTDELFIICEETTNLIKPGGEWTINKLKYDESREDDKIDIAILRLDETSISEIKKSYSFIKESDIELEHNDNKLPSYSIVGFPESKNRFNKHSNKLSRTIYSINTIATEKDIYDKLDYDKQSNIITPYNQKKLIDSKTKLRVKGPDGYGMSGSGMWFTKMQEIPKKDEDIDRKLIAMLIGHSKDNKQYWISTRIDLFIEIINQKY